jgi:hypothetical protein
VADEALDEALLRTLATGYTLGVAAAGNAEQQYGSGQINPGTGQKAPSFPCGISLLRSSDARVKISEGPTFDDVAFPGPAPAGIRPRTPDWSDVNLLCVAATTSYSSRLWNDSGRGDAAVDLAAPGQDITTLARPVPAGNNPTPSPAYVASGTSLAAPMVAGAAALLREAAPDAPIAEIARALRNGARRDRSFVGLVHYGSLDVACALSKLGERAKPGWKLVSLDDPNFKKATEDCGGKSTYVAQTDLARDTSYLRAKGKTTLSALVQATNLALAPSNSFRWQATLLGKLDARRVVFTSAGTAVEPADESVYDAGTAIVSCTEPDFAITAVRVEVGGGAARLWYFPTDGQAQRNTIQVALAVAAPLPKRPSRSRSNSGHTVISSRGSPGRGVTIRLACACPCPRRESSRNCLRS